MKTLRAKSALVLAIIVPVAPSFMFTLIGVEAFLQGRIEDCIGVIIIEIILILFGVYIGGKLYIPHWIRYGNGRVVISRVSKERVDGKAVGRWKRREDEFLLEEIVAYGLSLQALGHYVEYHYTNEGKFPREAFFKLKDGKRIGYEIMFYTAKQTVEFWKYIQDETGIVFQNSKPA